MASVILLLFAFAGASFVIGNEVKNGTFDIHNMSKVYRFSIIGYSMLIILVFLNGGYIAIAIYTAVAVAGFFLGRKLGRVPQHDEDWNAYHDVDGKPDNEPLRIPVSVEINAFERHEDRENDNEG